MQGRCPLISQPPAEHPLPFTQLPLPHAPAPISALMCCPAAASAQQPNQTLPPWAPAVARAQNRREPVAFHTSDKRQVTTDMRLLVKLCPADRSIQYGQVRNVGWARSEKIGLVSEVRDERVLYRGNMKVEHTNRVQTREPPATTQGFHAQPNQPARAASDEAGQAATGSHGTAQTIRAQAPRVLVPCVSVVACSCISCKTPLAALLGTACEQSAVAV